MGLIDSSNRPVYVASQPSNAAGALAPTRARGQVLGLDLYVDRNLSGTGDNTILAVNPESYTWYEGGSTTLRTDVIGSGQIEVALVNYGACARKVNAGAYKWMVA